jgi:hypothetical protein
MLIDIHILSTNIRDNDKIIIAGKTCTSILK